MLKYKRTVATLVALVVAIAVSACGAATNATSDSKGVIRVGMICSCSGAEASAIGRARDVDNAWVKAVNKAGGINGAQVQLYVQDDGLDPAKGLQAVKQLIEQDHVVAIVGDNSVVDSAWAPYAEQQGVPVIGGEPLYPPFATNKDFFPVGASLAVISYAALKEAKQAGVHKVGFIYCAESPVCANLAEPAGKYAKALGLGFVSAKVSATAPNYTAVCLQMKNSGVDSIDIQDTPAVVQRIIADCAAQGFKPEIASNTGSLSSELVNDPHFQGATLVSASANYLDASIPGVKDYLDTMSKYLPGLRNSEQFTYTVFWAWAGVKLFEAAAKSGDITGSSSAADVKKALYGLKDETLGGIAPPLNFTEDKPAFIPCYFKVAISGKTLVTKTKKPVCLEQTDIATVKAAGLY